MNKIAVWIVVMIIFGGCGLKTATVQTFTLDPRPQFGQIYHSNYYSKSVKIAYVTSIQGKTSSDICYSYDNLKEGSYQNAHWNTTGSQLIGSGIVRAIDQSKVFRSVVDYNSIANTDYLLESQIYEFCHKMHNNLSVSAVTVRFDLIDMQTNRLVKSKKLSYNIPTGTVDADGYVKATNRAFEQMSGDLIAWLAH
jgi:ABC-type uncharacterized transport system auxiliary subunit